MVLEAVVNQVRLSDPDGKKVLVSVSYLDPAVPETKTGEGAVVASATLSFDAGVQRDEVVKAVTRLGVQVQQAADSQAQMAAEFPTGTKIQVG